MLQNLKELWRYEGIMKRSWGLVLLEAGKSHWWRYRLSSNWLAHDWRDYAKKLRLGTMKGAYGRLLVKPNCVGRPMIWEMPVPRDDLTKNSSSNGVEWRQPEPRVLQRAGMEMGPKPMRAPKIMCRSQTLEQEAVKVALDTLRSIWDVRTLRYLPRKAVNTE